MSIVKVQKELKAPKNQYNNFGKYKYRSCEDILEALKPLLEKHKLTQTITDEIILVGERYYVKATVTVTEGDKAHSVSAFAREPLSKKGMDESQITGTASSYARKYALNGMWLIDDTKDADTDEHTAQTRKTQTKKDERTVLNAVKDGKITEAGIKTAQKLFQGDTSWDIIDKAVIVTSEGRQAIEKHVMELQNDTNRRLF